MITRKFKLYLNSSVAIPRIINVNQYDEGEQWVFTLYTEEGELYKPTSGAIIGLKHDGKAILNSASVNSNGQVVVTETKQMTASAGKAVFELLIDAETHGTANFIVDVEPRPADEGADYSKSDLSLLENAVGIVQAVTDVDEVINAKDIAKQASQTAVTASNNAETSKNQAVSSASQAQSYANTTKGYRDEVITAASAIKQSVTLFVDGDGYISVNYEGD